MSAGGTGADGDDSADPTVARGDTVVVDPPPRSTGEPAALRFVARTLSMLAGIGIVAMMLVTVADVWRRETGHGSIPGALEATEVALVAVVFASMMSAESSGTHVRTAILTSRLSRRAATVARLVGFCIVIAFLAWATYWTWDAGIDSMRKGERRFGGNEVPVWPSKLLIPVGFAGLALEYVAHAVGAVRSLKSGKRFETWDATADPGSLL